MKRRIDEYPRASGVRFHAGLLGPTGPIYLSRGDEMKLSDLVNFYKPPFRYVRLGDYTGCISDRIEDVDGFVLLEMCPDLFPNSEQHDTAHIIAAALTEQANAMLSATSPTPAAPAVVVNELRRMRDFAFNVRTRASCTPESLRNALYVIEQDVNKAINDLAAPSQRTPSGGVVDEEPKLGVLPASEWPPITELQKALWKDDPEFHAWACTVPDKHWAKHDLSALYVGLELGKRVVFSSPRNAIAPDGGETFYLASFKHGGDGYVLWWGPDNRGYTTDLEQAGVYTKIDNGYHDSADTVPVPVAMTDKLRVRRMVDISDSANGSFHTADKLRAAIAELHPAAPAGEGGERT